MVRPALKAVLFGLVLAMLPNTSVLAASKTFVAPEIRGQRLDWCAHFAADCGKPAADLFCKENGFSAASAFSLAPNIGRSGVTTLVFGDGRLCRGPNCSGFRAITCTNPDQPTFTLHPLSVAPPSEAPAPLKVPSQRLTTVPAPVIVKPTVIAPETVTPMPRPARQTEGGGAVAAPQSGGSVTVANTIRRGLPTRFSGKLFDPALLLRAGRNLPAGAYLFRQSGEFPISNDFEVDPTAKDQLYAFRWDVRKIAAAGGVRWQIAGAPFPDFAGGTKADLDPPGLIAQGDLPNDKGPVLADFRQLAGSAAGGAPPGSFYVRVIPVSAPGGSIVGWSSNVIRVYYRDKQPPSPPLTLPEPPRPLHLFKVKIVSFTPPQFFDPNLWGCVVVKSSSGPFAAGWQVGHRYCPPSYKGQGHSITSVGDFFDLVSHGLADALDWASSTYNKLKALAVKVVMDYTPFGLQCQAMASAAGMGSNACQTLATVAVNSGMAALGLPPSIPNFNQLVDKGVDAAVDLAEQTIQDQSGVPCVGPCDTVLRDGFSQAAAQLKQTSSQPECGVSDDEAHSYGADHAICAPAGVIVEPAPGSVSTPPAIVVQVTRELHLPDANNPWPDKCGVGAGLEFTRHLQATTAYGPTPSDTYEVKEQDVTGRLYRAEATEIPVNIKPGTTITIPFVLQQPLKFEFGWTREMWRTSQIPPLDEQGPMGPDWFTLYRNSTISVSAGTTCGGEADITATAPPMS